MSFLNESPVRLEFQLEHWRGTGPTWWARVYRNGNLVGARQLLNATDLNAIESLFESAGIPVSTYRAGAVERPRHLRGRDDT
jgi:hypothetical protein